MAFNEDIDYEGGHDSAMEGNIVDNSEAEKKKKKKKPRGKKAKNSRAAALDEESFLTGTPSGKEEAVSSAGIDIHDVANGVGKLNLTTKTTGEMPSTKPNDQQNSTTEQTNGQSASTTEQETLIHKTSNGTTLSSRFEKSTDTWSNPNDSEQPDHSPTSDEPQDIPESKKRIIDFFATQNRHPYHNLSRTLRERAIDHIHHLKHPDSNPTEWNRQMRLQVWRTVVRTNFFWTNPETGIDGAKPEPVVRPSGPWENSFDAFVECAAERLDRVGRDLPHPEWVKRVEDDVREFFGRVDRAGAQGQLQHLGFLLLFDEEQRKLPLTLVEFQERIRRSINGNAIAWKGMDFMKRGVPPAKPIPATSTLSMAEAVWKDVVTKL